MPVITYTAVDRGRLASGHSAATQYQIEANFESYPESMIPKGVFEETLDGTPEGYLEALQFEHQIQSDIVLLADREHWRELFSSVAATEEFAIDFTGTIASPDTDVTVHLVPNSVREIQIGGVAVKYSFTVRT